MAIYQKVKGTQDFYDVEANKMRKFERIASGVAKTYGFKEIITPIFEDTSVFVKNVGEDSDIVTKEMYTFNDKGDRSITLRPEGTAAVARMFIENKMYANPGITKLFYYGPMFRYERPQKGRFREFNQFGVEAYGASSPNMDLEIIASAFDIFKKLGLKDVILKINSIGDAASRSAYSKALKEYFASSINTMCDDCKRRINTNPLRILDCKVDSSKPIFNNVPLIHDYLNEESLNYYNDLIKGLDSLGIKYEEDYKLVRGLDYYTDTVFEFFMKDKEGNYSLALGGGGRYANLIKDMCGVDVSGIGYAFGIERLVSLMDEDGLNEDCASLTDCVIIGLDKESKIDAFKLARVLRDSGKTVEMDYVNTSLKSQFKLADRCNARFIVIIGEDERKSGIYTIKDKVKGTQDNINKDDILEYMNKIN